MRFLFLHQNFPGQFRHVSQALAARGHEVVGLGVNKPSGEPVRGVKLLQYRADTFPTPDKPLDHPLAGALHEFAGKAALGDNAARAMAVLQKQGFTPDVVVVHSGWGEAMFVKDVFPQARMIVYAEYYYGGPGSDTHFDPEFSRPSIAVDQRIRIRNTHLLHGLAACDAALTPTEFQKSRHPKWAQPLLRVIHEGIDTERFKPDANASVHLGNSGIALRPGDEVVTFVARHLEPYRGWHVFMRALPLMQQLRPQARFVIVGGEGSSYSPNPPAGKTWKEIFLSEVRDKLDFSRIHIVGRLPHAMLTQLMQVSAVHVYLTYPFVLSWSLLEAMSIGCLIVGSDTAPLREVVEDGRNGLLVDFFDHEALARKVADALARRDELAPLRAAARETVVSRYDLQAQCLPAMIEMLEEPFQA
jgi:glycosyltransferase involved in cell wall biosynthesis